MSSSFFRVSTANMYDSSVRNLSTRQKTLVDLQENLTSGKRVVRPSDDPVAAAQAERALTRISRIQTEQRALEVQRNAIGLAESTLGDAIGLVQEMRTLIVGAGGGALKNEDRKTYANQIQSLRDQLNEVINRKDTNGIPLLGALGSALQPFTGTLNFSGLPGQAASGGTAIAGMLDGNAALMFDPITSITRAPGSGLGTPAAQIVDPNKLDGASYSLKVTGVVTASGTTTVTYDLIKTDKAGITTTNSGITASGPTGQPLPVDIMQGPDRVIALSLNGTPMTGDQVNLASSPSLMSSIDSAIKDITNATNSTQAAQAVSQALAHMDAGIERLSNIRGYAGELLNRADRISSDQDNRSIQLEADRSRAEDLDMLKGISDFQNANVGLEAALKSYAQVQKLSLFNYING